MAFLGLLVTFSGVKSDLHLCDHFRRFVHLNHKQKPTIPTCSTDSAGLSNHRRSFTNFGGSLQNIFLSRDPPPAGVFKGDPGSSSCRIWTGQITTKPELRVDFRGDSLLNRHLGWPTGRKRSAIICLRFLERIGFGMERRSLKNVFSFLGRFLTRRIWYVLFDMTLWR